MTTSALVRELNPQEHIERVSIRPGVSVLSVLRHLNYKPWFALAEFVDNSVQSYLANDRALKALHGPTFRLIVQIDIDTGPPAVLKIRDNAGGITGEDYPRAFRPAEVPPDRTGLSEFGMGMKSAACWFAPRWKVRTSALGEPIERTVRFDINEIVNDKLEELEISEAASAADSHFTELVLDDPHHLPIKKTIGKIKEHLADIYRVFITEGVLDLRLNGESLRYLEPSILKSPYYKDPSSPSRLWRKDIAFDLGGGMSVYGFAAIRETGNLSRAGFALFRRKRLIEGSGDEGYRPDAIFGKSNSFRYQRLFGELHLEGFDVSHTKDGFRWDENEGPFLELLEEHLNTDDMPLLRQAEGYRARPVRNALLAAATEAADSTAEDMENKLPGALPAIAAAPAEDTPDTFLPVVPALVSRKIEITFQGQPWKIRIEITDDPAEGDWLSIANVAFEPDGVRAIEIRLAAAHPFMARFAQRDQETMEALLRVAAALAIAEVLFKNSGSKLPGSIRRSVNDMLREVFSKSLGETE